MADESLRDTIKAAIAQDAAGQDAGAADQGGVADVAGADAGAAQAAPGAAEGAAQPDTAGDAGKAAQEAPEGADRASQRRAPDGKFAKAADAEHTGAVDEQPPGQEPPEGETIRVPAGLPAPLKAKWSELPREWQESFAKQEDSFKVVRDAWAPKAERLNRLDEVIAPHREKLTMAGVDDATWLSRLIAAETVLERNPAEGLLYLARSYGVDQRSLVALLSGPQAAQLPQMPPEMAALYGEVQTLKQHITQSQQTEAANRNAALQAEIQRFANDPANLYFENVKDDIAALLQAGRASDLPSAYQMAIWANPETRGLLLKEQEAAARRAAPDPAVKAAAARAAAGSVTGAPGPGASGAMGANPGNLRETIRAALHEQAGAV